MRLEGSIVALVTPMKDSGEIDFQQLEVLIEHHIQAGTSAIVAAGTTGEPSTLSFEEHITLIQQTVSFVNKRIPVIAGTGANATKEAVFLTQQAKQAGADAALLVAPYYNKPTQEGLYQHYKLIAESVDIPQIVYNVPARTVVDMSNDTIVRLSVLDNIIGCKEASGDIARAGELVERCGDKIAIVSGDDATALATMKLGLKGDISVTANVAPHAMSAMCAAVLAGDFISAEKINATLDELHTILFIESNPIPVKYAVHKLGFTANTLRLPLTPLHAQHCSQIEAALERHQRAYAQLLQQ